MPNQPSKPIKLGPAFYIVILAFMGCINLNTIQAQTDTTYIDTVACDSLISPSGNFVWNANGTYSDTLTNSQGFDSILIITLTIPELTWQVWQPISGTAITVFSNATGYQWLDCTSNFSPVFGANTYSVYGTLNGGGTYACELDILGCKDTTECATFTGLGIDDLEKPSFKVFPNPTSDILIIDSDHTGFIDVEIIDGKGATLQFDSYKSGYAIDIRNVASGIGILRISTEDNYVESIPFIKKN